MNQEQQEYLNQQLLRGEAFESLVTQEGFILIKAYYENRVQAFANGLLLSEKEKIESYENERQRLIGIKQLFGEINSAIETLQHERQKPKPTATE